MKNIVIGKKISHFNFMLTFLPKKNLLSLKTIITRKNKKRAAT